MTSLTPATPTTTRTLTAGGPVTMLATALASALLADNPLPAVTQDRLALLAGWVQTGALRQLDLAFTQFIATLGGEDPAVLLAVALTSERNGHGHVCLSLNDALEQPLGLFSRLPDGRAESAQARAELHRALSGLTLDDWCSALAASPVVDSRLCAEAPADAGPAGANHPSKHSPSGADINGDTAADTSTETGTGARAWISPDAGIETGIRVVAGADTETGTDARNAVGSLIDDNRPLVLAGSRKQPLLYLRRYWAYEERIRDGIAARLQQPVDVDTARLRILLDRLFPHADAPAPDWQRIACALTARSGFGIVTGGPGTGKTTTVVKLLAVLHGLATAANQPPLLIELAAPTGKAAARLTESITDAIQKIPEDLRPPHLDSLKVKTLHRLLGSRGDGGFRHDAAHPLHADLVVVDEASMVDVEMMAHLLAAMRPSARLILLGDKDQLSSVEAGAVLGDLCRHAHRGRYRDDTLAYLAATGSIGSTAEPPSALAPLPAELRDPQGQPLDQAITMLRRSYRFRAEGGIGALAAEVNAERPKVPASDRVTRLLAIFSANATADEQLGRIDQQALAHSQDAALRRLVLEALGAETGYLQVMTRQRPAHGDDPAALDAWAKAVLAAQKTFQLLTPLRSGDWGVEGLNRQMYAWLRSATETRPHIGQAVSHTQWFHGRPVLVTRNDYTLDLMNGDIGVTLNRPEPAGDSRLRVAFPRPNGGIRWVLPSRLQAVETVFAMTVHKSQGSEFDHAALLMPDRSNPVLTRELLYTAITRARQRFSLLHGSADVLGETLTRRVQRISGLG